MKRSVSLNLGGRQFSFLSGDPQEVVEQVFSKVTEMYDAFKKKEEEIGFE